MIREIQAAAPMLSLAVLEESLQQLRDYLPQASCVKTKLLIESCLGRCCCADDRFWDEFSENWQGAAPVASCIYTRDLLASCMCVRCCPHDSESCFCDSGDVFLACDTEDEVEVTTADIADGVPREPASCPIALAIRRKYPSLQKVTVKQNKGVSITGPDGKQMSTELLEDERDWVRRFDRGEQVSPFTLKVRVGIVLHTTDSEWTMIDHFLCGGDWEYPEYSDYQDTDRDAGEL